MDLSGRHFYIVLLSIFVWALGAPYMLLFLHGTYKEYTRPDCNTTLWGVIIDAGSSGSRAHIYSWQRGRILETIREISHIKRSPGLSSYHHADHASQSLTKLLKHAKSVVPSICEAQTPVYVFATAGLRLTPTIRRREILESVRNMLRAGPYAFADKNVRVLPGSEEAEYDWISVNVARKSLISVESNGKTINAPEQEESVGVIDLGGASSQIAYETEAVKSQIPQIRSIALHHNSDDRNVRNVYAVSRINFGLYEAFQITHKISRQEEHNEQNWFACSIAKESTDDLGDFFECERLVSKFVIEQEPKSLHLDEERMSLIRTKPKVFYGIDNFAKLGSLARTVLASLNDEPANAKPFGLLKIDNELNIFQNAGIYICSSTWPQLRKMVPETVAKDRLLRKSCFGMAYVRALLNDVYNLTGRLLENTQIDQQKAQTEIIFAHSIDGVDGSWAIGAMVSQAFKDSDTFWKLLEHG